jgi:hypothetical protein
MRTPNRCNRQTGDPRLRPRSNLDQPTATVIKQKIISKPKCSNKKYINIAWQTVIFIAKRDILGKSTNKIGTDRNIKYSKEKHT